MNKVRGQGEGRKGVSRSAPCPIPIALHLVAFLKDTEQSCEGPLIMMRAIGVAERTNLSVGCALC